MCLFDSTGQSYLKQFIFKLFTFQCLRVIVIHMKQQVFYVFEH